MDNNGRWQDVFEQDRNGGRSTGTPPRRMPDTVIHDEDALALDLSVYKPWTLQRGRGRPAMMLDLRRYEPRSGLWTGWGLAYPSLVALEYTGDRMLSLDFGTRQFMIEGNGLDELARRFQEGTVIAVQEYAQALWPLVAKDRLINKISALQQ